MAHRGTTVVLGRAHGTRVRLGRGGGVPPRPSPPPARNRGKPSGLSPAPSLGCAAPQRGREVGSGNWTGFYTGYWSPSVVVSHGGSLRQALNVALFSGFAWHRSSADAKGFPINPPVNCPFMRPDPCTRSTPIQ